MGSNSTEQKEEALNLLIIVMLLKQDNEVLNTKLALEKVISLLNDGS